VPVLIIVLGTILIISVIFLPCNGNALHQQDGRVWKYDEMAVPFYYYGPLGYQRNPLYIAGEAIHHYDDRSYSVDKKFVLNNADWLVKNTIRFSQFSLLPYKFAYRPYDLAPPWFSSMAQARALTALIDAHKISNNQKYLDTAKSLLNSFFVEVKDGGVTYKTKNDGWWYEMYASSKSNTEPRVLNGMLLALLDIHRYYDYSHDPNAKFLFDEGFLALRKNISRYNYLGYSFYDIYGRPAGIFYHKYHVSLLKQLLEIQNDDIIKRYYIEWAHYRGPYPKYLLINFHLKDVDTSNPLAR
jgi:heparosan-N-sulfate-glucuronate 5-epimerase